MQIQLVWCIMAIHLIFKIPNIERELCLHEFWCESLILSPLLILSSSKSENVWTSQRNVLGIQRQDPHQCERFPACGSLSAGPHAPRLRQCAALFISMSQTYWKWKYVFTFSQNNSVWLGLIHLESSGAYHIAAITHTCLPLNPNPIPSFSDWHSEILTCWV